MNSVRISVPTPFAVGCVNAYLVGSENPTLIDCGPLTEEAWSALVAGIEGAGYAVEQIERLILTHAHIDHSGLAHRIQEVAECEVFAHPVDHALLRDISGAWSSSVVDFLVEACRRAGVPSSFLREVECELSDHRRYTESIETVTALEEGDVLSLPEGVLKVLHTPGHSRGSICLWEPQGASLWSGDTLIPHISSNALLAPGVGRFREKSLPKYVQSLERIAALKPASVFPGHGEPMQLPERLIPERIAFSDRRADRIRELVDAGADRPWTIADRLFPTTQPGSVFLAVSEVVGHLDLLAGRGTLHFEGEDAPWRIRPAISALEVAAG